MKAYLDLLRGIRQYGVRKKSRPILKSTGQAPDTFAVFGETFRHDLEQGFPLLTTKKIDFSHIVHENLWFLSGKSSIKYLQDNNVKIWDAWSKDVDGEPDVGPVYGVQWRNWQAPLSLEEMGDQVLARLHDADPRSIFEAPLRITRSIDQLANVVKTLRTNPSDRRMVVTAWNPADLSKMGLPPCHMIFQFGVLEGRLHCLMMQRSADTFLGVPYNIAGYALLTHMLAHITGLRPGVLTISFGDLHLYENHLERVDEQLTREAFSLPWLKIDPSVKELDDFRLESFDLQGYHPQGALRAEVAV